MWFPAQFVAIAAHRIIAVDDRTLRLDGVGPPLVPRRRMPDVPRSARAHRKPRRAGITHVIDRGLSPLSLESLLVTAGEHIDMIKLGWGTAYVSGAVGDKVAICREAGVAVCPGGTLLEIAVHQGRLDRYVEWLHELGIDHVEVSNGSLPLTRSRKGELIAKLAREFTVIAEVGSQERRRRGRGRLVRGDALRPRRPAPRW